jgi:hypothetical protein
VQTEAARTRRALAQGGCCNDRCTTTGRDARRGSTIFASFLRRCEREQSHVQSAAAASVSASEVDSPKQHPESSDQQPRPHRTHGLTGGTAGRCQSQCATGAFHNASTVLHSGVQCSVAQPWRRTHEPSSLKRDGGALALPAEFLLRICWTASVCSPRRIQDASACWINAARGAWPLYTRQAYGAATCIVSPAR